MTTSNRKKAPRHSRNISNKTNGLHASSHMRSTQKSASSQLSSRTAEITRRAQKMHPGKKKAAPQFSSQQKRLFVGVTVILLAVSVFVIALVVVPRVKALQNPGSQVAVGTQVNVVIPEGSGASEVANVLSNAGVISNTKDFLTQIKRGDSAQEIKSGTYSLTAGDDLSHIIDQLVRGPNVDSSQVTVPEGYTVKQTAQTVEAALGISATDFMNQAKASNYTQDFPFLADAKNDSLEGYLFPKTYNFSGKQVDADTVIRAMLTQYQTEANVLGLDDAAQTLSTTYNLSLNANDVVTLASLVEREAKADDQRGSVASVFYNRLSSGMNLQSDATLVYSLGRDVTAADLTVDDPYNTYTRAGLTPTPICSAGVTSLKAAINPDTTNYYYFYISGDYAAFSETYEQHQQAIADRPQ